MCKNSAIQYVYSQHLLRKSDVKLLSFSVIHIVLPYQLNIAIALTLYIQERTGPTNQVAFNLCTRCLQRNSLRHYLNIYPNCLPA